METTLREQVGRKQTEAAGLSDDLATLGDTLRKCRERAGITAEEASARLGISISNLTKWETGKTSPRADKLVAMSDVYGCRTDELLGRMSRKSLRDYREGAGLTVSEVASRLNTSPSTVRGWEHGRIPDRDYSEVADAYQMDYDDLEETIFPPTERDEAARRTIAARLRSLRESHGLTVADVAELCGEDESKVLQWEAGIHCIRMNDAVTLADRYGVTLDDFCRC